MLLRERRRREKSSPYERKDVRRWIKEGGRGGKRERERENVKDKTGGGVRKEEQQSDTLMRHGSTSGTN